MRGLGLLIVFFALVLLSSTMSFVYRSLGWRSLALSIGLTLINEMTHSENSYRQDVFLQDLRHQKNRYQQRIWSEHQHMQLSFLLRHGFKSSSTVLDLGCGPMRLGFGPNPLDTRRLVFWS